MSSFFLILGRSRSWSRTKIKRLRNAGEKFKNYPIIEVCISRGDTSLEGAVTPVIKSYKPSPDPKDVLL